ncbi:ETX/MTX2 family pore-forming toxin [Bacillus sp. 166amftsu]|uniref:ETX/MTX2 family pore-forming toxin n=1 Tax=Bacillus sp. 166amftsu TaxID=1761753 RepID=UPI00089AF4C2|nr:ETX/MTX2 family pore-forming toxin [Bacillus sp. 166amftsu]SDZ44671.1 toxin ETX/toxin MTX2 [Bacillus sp. 166amftsu]
MLKNTKKTKQILSLAMIGAIGASFAFASPSSASAAQINPIQNIAAGEEKPYIENWDEPFKKMFSMLQNGDTRYKNFKNPQFVLDKVVKMSVEEDGSPITNAKTLFVGKTIFKNDLDHDQTFTTNEFSKTIEHSVSSSTTHGFNLGVTAGASFGIPGIGEGSVEISTEYNFSNTNENTKTESYTYTASPQNIVVPAHSAVEVSVILNTVKINGNVDLTSTITGKVNYSDGSRMTSNNLQNLWYDAFRYNNSRTSDLNVAPVYDYSDRLYDKVTLKGKGKYSAEYGTQFSVTVKPVEMKPRALAVTSSGTDASTNEDYTVTNEGHTYTVQPEVKKEN